jgi:polyisoprenoid-binding protein YceI
MSSDRRRATRDITVLALVVALAAPAAASAARWAAVDVDAARTVVRFAVDGTAHETHGTFRVERGAIGIDTSTGAARGSVIVDAASGDSGNGARDRRMKDVVLLADAHPRVEFDATRFDGALGPDGELDGTLHGMLVLLGVPHPIEMATHGRLVDGELTAGCHFTIPYVAWGLTDPSVLFLKVAKDVAIDVAAVGHVTWTEAAP